MGILILLTVFQMVSLVGSYEFICPSQAHWNLRAKSMCKPTTNYTCLFDINLQINVYRDRCYRPSIVGPGYKYVFQPNLNRAACSYNRYQPFIFETVGYSDCSFQKSLCNSLGQETYENSNTRSDKTCICNTDKGYTFVRNSNNQCYCNPSTEDCSCYLGVKPYNTTTGLEDIQCYDDMKMSKSLYTEDMFNVSQTIKIIEFDNYKYNLNDHLSNAYRIEAAMCVFILPLAYIVVSIVVVRIIRLWIQARSTPRKVDIVDRTDCSMTIAWFMDVPDECLSYELDHQPPGTNNLTVRSFSSKDVVEDVNGRRMYTVKNLLPETNYAFKLRSIYKDVKSHYSNFKTKQTLKEAPRKFDIIDWTDCSITIEWFMDVPDECLSYELDHRPPGTDYLPVISFSSKDVVEDVNGRRMYHLINLLPETKYAFKLRSFYKDSKSHYTDTKIKQTLKEAPRKFEIIDWTDCSMTIEWFMYVQDECLSYELDHRPPGTDNLLVRSFSSKDVVEDVNGRRMYTLKNLLPETKYAFKLRSFYKDTKSHYTNTKTKQTLKEAPRKFDIIDWTDRSMTIEWFMGVQDECLSYELYDVRPKGTDNLLVRSFSSKDAVEDVNGRRMYTLKDLLPETKYAFKLRSVYKDANSHYSISKTEQTLKKAPRKFDIIDWTYCSMTIEWFMDDQDECLSYELDDRPPGTDNLPIRTFYSKHVVEGKNGRRMYTLKDLLPETNYAFKLRSVYKDVKSHYSDSKTEQTLKKALPEAVKKLSEEDKARYNKLMQSEKSEKRYFVRIMIVGKGSAGKTCLLRRLLKKDISDVTSTDGVEIVVRRCKINIADGTWTVGKEIDDDKVDRITRVLIPTTENRDSQHMQEDEKKNIKIKNSDDMSTDKIDTTTKAKVSMDKSDDKNESELVMHEDLATEAKVSLEKNEDANETASLVKHEDFATDTKVGPDKNEDTNETASLAMPEDLLSSVFSKSHENTLSNRYALCALWDFAGQKEFYATHQAFLTSCAVYLVVADMKDDISKQGLSQCFAEFQDIGEYVDFWFDSIHCHRTADKLSDTGHFDPPILLVFTGKDNYNKVEFEKREQELKNQMDQVLGLQSKYHHLHDTFYLSNTKDIDEVFGNLQNAIYEAARTMDNWGNTFPLKWILLEHLIEINKNAGRNFINFNDMYTLAKHHNINILNEDDLLLFLRFQHNVGNIIFFEDIRDFIILNPQWLADAFRCLVSDRFDKSRLQHLEDWTLFIRQGKISESLITELFKSKDESTFSGQKHNLNKVMEKLDILVKIENSSYYIMPSMMPSSKLNDVCKTFGIIDGKCERTSWLCFKFEFLPPSFFNHLSAWFIRHYKPSTVDNGTALYRGICMFDIDRSGCKKILVTMSTVTIALQVVSFSAQKGFGSTCSDIYSKVKQLIEEIKEKYQVKISSKLHFKCSDGDYYKDTFEYDTLTNNQECFCPQHQTAHLSEQIYSPWMDNEVKEIPDRAKINTTQDDQNPEIKPNKEAFDEDQAYVKNNFPVSVTLRQQLNITRSKNESQFIFSCIKTGNTLVFTDYDNRRLIICNSDGSDIHHIPLSYIPLYITEIESNTVAVSCRYRTILIINISTRSVTSTFNTRGNCLGISYNDNNLYVVIGTSIIHVMDLTGKVIRTIPLPTDFIYNITVDRDRLVCIDDTSIYCCSLDGKVMWKFKMNEFQHLTRVTTDDEGNIYVTDYKTHTVIVVSDDGKHHRELLTKSDGLNGPWGIYFDKKENVLLVCNTLNRNAFLFDVKYQHK